MRRQWIFGLVVVCAVVGIALGVRQLDGRIDDLEATVIALTNSRPGPPQSRVSPASRIQLEMPLNACIQHLGDPDEAFLIHMHSKTAPGGVTDYHWSRFDWKTRYTDLAEKYECPKELNHQLERMLAGSPVTSYVRLDPGRGGPNITRTELALRWGNITVFFDDQSIARHIFVEPEATAKP